MIEIRARFAALALVIVLSASGAAAETAISRDFSGYQIAVNGPGANMIQHSTGSIGFRKSQVDTFYLYGGPGTVEGKFQSFLEGSGGIPDAQGWFGVDHSERAPHWRATTTNAATLNGGTPGNHAVASHHDDTDYQGYGNSWNDWLVFTLDVSALGFDPAADTISVQYTCEFVHDTEPGFDYLQFDWNRAGSYESLAAIDGSSYVDSTSYYAPVNFDSGPLTYTPADYVDGKVMLRLRVTSDGGWSDQDGFYPTQGRGAAAVDNIEVRVNDNPASFADWEPLPPKADLPEGDVSGHDNGADIGTAGWLPTVSDFVGDFSKLFGQFQDIDPCRDNITPIYTFIDDGTPPNNDALGRSTGGSLSANWNYGVPGGWVVNYTGGLTGGTSSLFNEIWSPPFDWDLPGTVDDVANGGAMVGFTRWSHMPLTNGIFAMWRVRVAIDGVWGAWEDNNFVYYSNSPAWGNFTVNVTDKIPQGVDQVQVVMGAVDMAAIFDFPGTDAAPSPAYDNVYFKKYVIGGPVLSTRTINLASDGFPNDGTLDGSIRWDMCLDTAGVGDVNVPGDSITIDIISVIPGASLADPVHGGTMKVSHLCNPDFAAQRAAAMASVGAVFAGHDNRGWEFNTYDIPGDQSTINGTPVQDRYNFDLPDGPPNVNAPHQVGEDAIFFPGDVIHYYVEAADDLGNITTLPTDVTGFLDMDPGTLYDRLYTVRGLPTIWSGSGGSDPFLLFWNDFGHRGGEAEYYLALARNALREGREYDTYTTKGPGSLVGNGLGSSGHHGANAAQLDGYDAMIYVSGNLSNGLISDGSDATGNGKSDDSGVLTAWHNAPKPRFHAYWGDDLAQGMVNQGVPSQTYLNNIIGVDALGDDVGPKIEGQTASTVVPTPAVAGSFWQSYVAFGGCLVINDFDDIAPFGGGPVVSHEFTDRNGIPYGSAVPAGVIWDRLEGGNQKITVLFPYGFQYIRGSGRTGGAARDDLMEEVLALFGWYCWFCDPGVEDSIPIRLVVDQNHPNPFNPTTTIRFSAPHAGDLSVKIYNVRGELVRVLHDGFVEAGERRLIWHGRDDNGAEVASGVYLYRVRGFGEEIVHKMALVR